MNAKLRVSRIKLILSLILYLILASWPPEIKISRSYVINRYISNGEYSVIAVISENKKVVDLKVSLQEYVKYKPSAYADLKVSTYSNYRTIWVSLILVCLILLLATFIKKI